MTPPIDARAILADLLARLHRPYLTREEAAEYLGVSVRTLDAHVSAGTVRTCHIPGIGDKRPILRFTREDLDRLVARDEAAPHGTPENDRDEDARTVPARGRAVRAASDDSALDAAKAGRDGGHGRPIAGTPDRYAIEGSASPCGVVPVVHRRGVRKDHADRGGVLEDVDRT